MFVHVCVCVRVCMRERERERVSVCVYTAGERSDLLLHFCHGAPGFIFLFLKAHEVWGADAYRQALRALIAP